VEQSAKAGRRKAKKFTKVYGGEMVKSSKLKAETSSNAEAAERGMLKN
jgi:hypothetical protein